MAKAGMLLVLLAATGLVVAAGAAGDPLSSGLGGGRKLLQGRGSTEDVTDYTAADNNAGNDNQGSSAQEGGNWYYVNPRQNTTCSDVPPDDRFSCDQQKRWGTCDANFMLRGNYCSKTCGRCVPGGNAAREKKRSFYVNPRQNASRCHNVPPDSRHSCKQQREFGKCFEVFMLNGSYCQRTCGRPPCPAVANVTRASNATNATTLPIVTVRPAPVVTTAIPVIGTPTVPAASNASETLPAAANNLTTTPAVAGTEPVLTPVPVGASTLAAVSNETATDANNTAALPAEATAAAGNSTAALATALPAAATAAAPAVAADNTTAAEQLPGAANNTGAATAIVPVGILPSPEASPSPSPEPEPSPSPSPEPSPQPSPAPEPSPSPSPEPSPSPSPEPLPEAASASPSPAPAAQTPIVVATPPVANATAPVEAAATNATAPVEAAAENATAPVEAAATNATAPVEAAAENATAPVEAATANAANSTLTGAK